MEVMKVNPKWGITQVMMGKEPPPPNIYLHIDKPKGIPCIKKGVLKH